MTLEHRIRLPKPWDVVVREEVDRSRFDGHLTIHEFQRNFQRPSGLDASTRIELDVQLQQANTDSLLCVDCLLNDCDLGSDSFEGGRGSLRLTLAQLMPSNRLLIRVTWRGAQPDASIPQVAIVLNHT